MKKKLTFIIFIIFLFGTISAQDDPGDKSGKLRKETTSEDDAFGILDKGELINSVGNQGMITDSYYQNLIYNFRWPKSKGVANMNGVNAMDDLCILFAHKGNVLDAYTRYRAEDWQAPPGALGKYHAEDQPAYLLAPDGAPRLAHSDIPLTWPKGYFDDFDIWHDAPTGDYSSLSDDDKKIVDSKGAFFDEDKNIWRFWPGNFRMDIDPTSPTFGEQVPGEFAADREVYIIATDHNAQPPSKPMGMKLEIQGYSYGRRFAQDIQFYDVKITNTSSNVLDSCYYGYYVDFQFGDVLEETYGSFNTNINPKGYDNAFYQFDYNGSSPGNIEEGYMGIGLLATPFDMGVTDAHFFRDLTGNITPAEDKNIWPVMISDPNSPNLMSDASNYFHGSNTHFDDFSLTAEGNLPGPSNWTLYADSGPFTLQPGESMHSTLVVAMGDDLDDLKGNFQIAQKLFLNKFLGPSTPPSPSLKGVAQDGKVVLYWDDKPERAIDLVSKKTDFEGYKIYRSQDQGATWGDEIRDSKGKLVGYVPIAQFDKKNLIQGVDIFNNFNYLGDNTGLVHYFVDSNVVNGVHYSYTITSYDSGSVAIGLESMESSRGTTSADANLVDVTPRSDAIGFVNASSSISQIADVGNGSLSVNILDVDQLTGDDYLVVFNKTPADSFFVVNESNDDTLTRVALGTSEMKVIEGFSISVTGDDVTGEVKSIVNHLGENVEGADHPSADGNWFVNMKNNNALADQQSKGSDYEFRFTQTGSYASGLTGHNKPMLKKYSIPFEIWNMGNPNKAFQVNCILLDKNKNEKLDFGEDIRITNSPYVERGDTIGTFSLLKWYYTVSIDSAAGGGRLPLDGESFKISVYSELTAKDSFRIQIEPPHFQKEKAVVEKEIDQVRVVPNPFLVNAPWEQLDNNRRLRFMFLPPECTISIYTVRGELVKQIDHNNNTGDEDWNLTNSSGVEVAYGLYIYVVQTPSGEKTIGKFAIIK